MWFDRYMTNTESPNTTTTSPLVGRKVWALTMGADKSVVILVTAIECQYEYGTEVWGYRVNTRQRNAASTAYPRRYFVPAP